MTSRFTIMSLVLLLTVLFSGCDLAEFAHQVEDPNSTLNNAAEGAALTAAAGKLVLDSPAGNLIPAPIRIPIRLGLELLGGLVALFITNKYKILRKVTGTIVQAIEEAPPETSADIKVVVQKNMIDEGVYADGKKIVQELK